MKTKSEVKSMPLAPNKPRKCASVFQVRELEKTFESDPRPSHDKRIQLAKRLDMMPRTVQIWFQNRRAKARSQNHLMVKAVNCPPAQPDFKPKPMMSLPYCFSPQTNLDCFMDFSPPEMDTPPNQAFAPYDFSYPALDPWASFSYDQQFLDISLGLNPMCNPMAAHMGNPLGGMVGTPQPEFFQPITYNSYPQAYSRQQNPPMYSMSYPPLMDMGDEETKGHITLSSENNPHSTQ